MTPVRATRLYPSASENFCVLMHETSSQREYQRRDLHRFVKLTTQARVSVAVDQFWFHSGVRTMTCPGVPVRFQWQPKSCSRYRSIRHEFYLTDVQFAVPDSEPKVSFIILTFLK